VYTKWTSHLKTEEEKKRFENSIVGSRIVLERLRDLIDERLKELDKLEVDFNNPNWSYREASIIGARKDLRDLRKLINLDEQAIKTGDT
jgi:3-methyladenine DNA glycosylase AlkD